MLRGRDRRSRKEIVVKIELVPGALATERVALDWVSAHGGPVPSLRAASTIGLPDGRPAACLVTDHVAGRAPDTNDGWRRLGQTLASLAELPCDGSPLSVRDAVALADAHAQRLGDLSTSVDQAIAGGTDWDR